MFNHSQFNSTAGSESAETVHNVSLLSLDETYDLGTCEFISSTFIKLLLLEGLMSELNYIKGVHMETISQIN